VEDLASWAVMHHLPRQSLNGLLLILRKHDIEVPKDSITLLKTPRSVENVFYKCGGHHHYEGIEKAVVRNMDRLKENPSFVELSVNIDDLPLSKSSNQQLWPILGSINNCNIVFIIAIFYGASKPNNVDEYLEDFVNEVNHLNDVDVRLGETCVLFF